MIHGFTFAEMAIEKLYVFNVSIWAFLLLICDYVIIEYWYLIEGTRKLYWVVTFYEN